MPFSVTDLYKLDTVRTFRHCMMPMKNENYSNAEGRSPSRMRVVRCVATLVVAQQKKKKHAGPKLEKKILDGHVDKKLTKYHCSR